MKKYDTQRIKVRLPDATISHFPALFCQNEADILFNQLKTQLTWKQEDIKIFGKICKLPRLTSWCSDKNETYTFSGIVNRPSCWTAAALKIKNRIECQAHYSFNSMLANLYRDGSDGIAWHSDNEPELGSSPVIGSVSFGVSRPFKMRHKILGKRHTINLNHGSFLLMSGKTQSYWLHSIPRTKRAIGARINLTFRTVGIDSLERTLI